jgi:hypothetical protein
MLHPTDPTTRPAAWRLMVAVVAFVAYLLAGMHLACAGDLAGLAVGGDVAVSSSDDDSDADGEHAVAHCHAAHLQAESAAGATPQPGASASRMSVRPDPRHASADPPRLEDPPRS